ncbi:MAG: preprotein translocase subunit SecB [Halothiobacillaceae bacterium]|nr:MAG: preprotein translocase subunit SecB [Halothiobacillaceae bacterium]
MADANSGANNAGQQKQFQIQKIYIKDVSLETPNSPQIFQAEWAPEVNIQLGNSAVKLADTVHEIITSVTVTAKLGENTAYLVEVHQAGIFTMSGFSVEELGVMVGSYCPNILFPYAREAVSDLVIKAGFPQLTLAPVNFDAIYAQHQQQLQAQQSSKEGAAAKGVH